MAIEVFNTTLYAYQAPANDPDNAVFVQSTTLYGLDAGGAGPNSIFVQYHGTYEVFGGIVDDLIRASFVNLYSIESGLVTAGPLVATSQAYQIDGGAYAHADVAVPKTKMYLITV